MGAQWSEAHCYETFCSDDVMPDDEDIKEKIVRGAAIHTARGLFCYPEGVAVDKLHQHGPRQSLRGLNAGVSGVLINRGAQEAYAEFAEAMTQPIAALTWPTIGDGTPIRGARVRATSGAEDDEKLATVLRVVLSFDQRFKRSGVSVHLCVADPLLPSVSTAEPALPSIKRSVKAVQTRWITYVDRVVAPRYKVWHDVQNRDSKQNGIESDGVSRVLVISSPFDQSPCAEEGKESEVWNAYPWCSADRQHDQQEDRWPIEQDYGDEAAAPIGFGSGGL